MNILEFIKRERIYLWMIFFILAVNVLSPGRLEKKTYEAKKSISAKTFKEMGITEDRVKLFFESKRPSAVFFKYSLLSGFFIFLTGIIVNLAFIFRRKDIVPAGSRPKKDPGWKISDIFRVIIITVFTGYILGVAGGIILRIYHFDIDINLRMILGTFFMDIAAISSILYFVLVKYKQNLTSLGIGPADFYRNIAAGIIAYIGILPILIVTLILSILFLDMVKYQPPPQPIFDMFLEEKRNNVILFLSIFVSVLGPIIEEVFFRGFLYSAVKKRFGVIIGVLLSAGLFSILHTNIVGFLPIMILGVLMAFLYETTGSLIASMAVHILHNSIIVGFVFFIKELLR